MGGKNSDSEIDSMYDGWFRIINVVSEPLLYNEQVIHDPGNSIVVG